MSTTASPSTASPVDRFRIDGRCPRRLAAHPAPARSALPLAVGAGDRGVSHVPAAGRRRGRG
ncbi:hypothetical protein JM654_18575 [Microbacterium oxydans]|nr:hypothetical protein [Microbacterium oxydans]